MKPDDPFGRTKQTSIVSERIGLPVWRIIRNNLFRRDATRRSPIHSGRMIRLLVLSCCFTETALDN
jgi:hypothetical protein